MRKTFRPPPPPTGLHLLARALTHTQLWRATCVLLGLTGVVLVVWLLGTLLITLTAVQNGPATSLPDAMLAGSTSAPTPLLVGPATPYLAAQTTESQGALKIGLMILGALDVALIYGVAVMLVLEAAYNFIRHHRTDYDVVGNVGNTVLDPFIWAQRPVAGLLNLGLWSLVAYKGFEGAEYSLIAVAFIALQFTVLPLLAALLRTLGWELQRLRNRLHFGRSNV